MSRTGEWAGYWALPFEMAVTDGWNALHTYALEVGDIEWPEYCQRVVAEPGGWDANGAPV